MMQAPHTYSCLSEQTPCWAPHNLRSHDADYAAKVPTSLPSSCLLYRVLGDVTTCSLNSYTTRNESSDQMSLDLA